jgi:hypothetical protein
VPVITARLFSSAKAETISPEESKLFEQLFEQIVRQCVEVGLVEGKHLSVDGSFVEANAAKGEPDSTGAVEGSRPSASYRAAVPPSANNQDSLNPSLKPSVPVFRERAVMRDLLIETQTSEPAPRQMHTQLFHQPPLAGDAVQIANQQNAQQKFGINRGPAGLAVAIFQLLPDELEADVLVDQPQQVGLRNLIFQAKVIEQRFGAVVLPIMISRPPKIRIKQSMGECFLLTCFC